MVYYTKTAQETRELGKKIARQILAEPRSGKNKGAVVLALEGELGAGKTSFLQGLAQGLGIKEKITSPTFVLVKQFHIPQEKANYWFKEFIHIDCYRIKNPEELLNLGFKEIIATSHNIVAIEWADRVKSILPPNTIALKLEHQNKSKTSRKITLEVHEKLIVG